MATPISEQIALKVKQRLQLIDEGSGYETSVEGTVVRAPRIWEGNLKDYQIIVSQGPLSYNEELSHPGNPPAAAWDLPFVIVGELRPSEDDTTALDTLANEFSSDIFRSICTPQASWHNWDGLAINTQFGSVEIINADEMAAVRVEITVTYRVDEINPYTVRS